MRVYQEFILAGYREDPDAEEKERMGIKTDDEPLDVKVTIDMSRVEGFYEQTCTLRKKNTTSVIMQSGEKYHLNISYKNFLGYLEGLLGL